MSSEQKEQPNRPTMCANNCGFYGNPANRNLCSKCYHDFLQKEAAKDKQCSRLSDHHSSNSAAKLRLDRLSNREMSVLDESSNAHKNQTSVTTGCDGSNSFDNTFSNSTDSSISNSGATSDALSSSIPSGPSLSTAVSAHEKYSKYLTSPVLDSSVSKISEKSVVPEQKDKSRCNQCNRKIGLLGFSCRCGQIFCGKHLAVDMHNCQFDYKTFEREQLRKQNNRVVADKLEKL